MAVDKRGRKLPKGIQQRYEGYEGRFMYQGKRYLVHGNTITETQKYITELKYKLEHGIYVTKEKITLDEWYKIWLEEYKKNRVKILSEHYKKETRQQADFGAPGRAYSKVIQRSGKRRICIIKY